MLYELITTASMAGIAGTTYYFNHQKSDNDHEKIKTIADTVGLKNREGSIRIYRKSTKNRNKKYSEYIYKIPLGLSFQQFEDAKQIFVDGLNNKSRPDFNLKNLKNINWKGDVIKQLKDIFNNRIKLDKQIEMSYDGMLRFKVYDEGLGTKYAVTEETIKSKPWHVPLGKTMSGEIVHNFEKSPHILLGGATDMGKSTIINLIVNTLVRNNPNDVEFTMIDLKGGLELGAYENLKQTKHFATNVSETKKVLESVVNQMNLDFEKLRKSGKKDIKQAGIKKRKFIIIDEAAELSSAGELDNKAKADKIQCENYIKDIARRGRASGIRLIYSTQYPTAETISSQVKRNLLTRICLAVDTSVASQVVLDEKGAEELPIIQGRAIYKHHKKEVMQSYFIDEDLIENVIAPHIRIRAKEDVHVSDKEQIGTAGADTFIIEETRLS